MEQGPAGRDVAVVIGAGIGGLAAARVLAPRYRRVLVLDRDELPDCPAPRRGVPQGNHGHVLLVAGQQALERLFPGLDAELVAAGATPFDPGTGLRLHRYGRVYPPLATDLRLVSMSRPLLETRLRRRVLGLPTVALRTGTAVAGLTGTGTAVTGVTTGDGEAIRADLVVDCSGRGSRSDRWLAALGYPAPAALEVRVGVGYATRLLHRDPGDLPGAVGVFVLPTPPDEKRVGLVVPVEDDRWLVSLGGWHGAHAGPGDDGFRAHAAALPEPSIAALLARARPAGQIVTITFPASRWRRFDRLARPAAGYLALGDAVCSFNPVYGQGMTCAAMQAEELGRVLDRYPRAGVAMSRAFHRAVARVIATPWRFAVGGDFAFAETTGARPPAIGLLNRYGRAVQRASQSDPVVRRAFTGVQQLVRPPAALFSPAVVARVVRGARRADRA